MIANFKYEIGQQFYSFDPMQPLEIVKRIYYEYKNWSGMEYELRCSNGAHVLKSEGALSDMHQMLAAP